MFYLLICFLFLIFISLDLEYRLISDEKKIINILINYGIYILLNNTISLTLMYIFFDINSNFQLNINTYSGIAIKYTSISIVVAIILTIIKVIITKNIEVNIETEVQKNN